MGAAGAIREPVDAIFISYYEDLDRYHNDGVEREAALPSSALAALEGEDEDLSAPARHARQSARIDGELYDLRRFFSRAAHGTTAEYRRYCAFAPNHLSGLYYRSLLARHGYSVHHVNCADRVVLAELGRALEPRFVLLSTTFLNETPYIMTAVQHVRRAFPGARLVLGGLVLVELSRSMPEAQFARLLAAWGADLYIVSPEGEEALLGALAHEGQDLRGLDLPKTWVREGRAVRPPSARPEASLSLDDSWVRWSLLDPASLYHAVHTRTARSCAFTCSFCSYFSTQGPLVLASPDTLRRELEELSALGSVRSLIFTDDTFNVPPKRFKELCRVLRDFDFEWYSFFRAQYADAETVELMRSSGCRAVFLGIESIDDKVLKNMHKSATYEAYCRGVGHLKEADIWLHANFIVGYPGDTAENVAKTIDFVDRFGIDFFTASPWYCSPGTPVWEMRAELGVEGKYFAWRHATMSSLEADELTREMILAPRHSTFMSELTANSFWHQLLFYANGYTPSELRPMVAAFNAHMGRDVSSAEFERDPAVRELARRLAARPMPAPPDVAAASAARARRSACASAEPV